MPSWRRYGTVSSSSLSKVRVLRQEPRSRDRVDGLAGRLHIRLRTCSRSLGDPLDSHLHVGTGFLRLIIDEEELRRRASLAKNRADLERLVREFSEKIQEDYAQFVMKAGTPVVPGSSVKGNVRSRLELSFSPKGYEVRCCLIAVGGPLQPPQPGQHGWRHFSIWEKSLRFPRDKACNYTGKKAKRGVCLLCDLFGTAGLSALIEFGDLEGKGESHVQVDLPTY